MTIFAEKTSTPVHLRDKMTEVLSHPEEILEYRKSEYARMGFPDYLTEYLAATFIDLHEMERLLKNGCPHDLAMEILIGTWVLGPDDPNWVYDSAPPEPTPSE